MIERPQEIARPHLLANWRKKTTRKRRSAQQRREGNCARHLELLRQCPCVVTGEMPARQVHHLKSGPARKERGVGMRATDRWGLPLAHKAHLHGVELLGSRNELAWFQANSIRDPYALAEALWHAPRDVAAMTAIILAHRGAK